ncbi:Cu(I)-responsive transcriptional regulator [Pokkaliibacter sp. CJK22405]|uniref:Cu(I)-responsive transcriptional regulator n=1 Tax=Pokkaliibacter sp. CJK22405 TaxID=3384615 RepID=UPI0039850CD5
MKISDVAKQTGLSAKTLRYYESIGLISPTARAENGYRRYTDADLRQLGFIQRARSLGFTLDECRDLLALYNNPLRASASVKEVAQRRIEELDQEIHRLTQMRQSLDTLIDQCQGNHSPHCAIIDSLESVD